MRSRGILSLSLSLSLILCVVALAALLFLVGDPARAQGSTRYVATTGADSGGCTNPGDPCRTLQYAVDVAGEGDVIKVAAGTYSGVHPRPAPPEYPYPPSTGIITQVVYLSKTLTIRGGYTTTNGFADPPHPEANPITLDAQEQGRVMLITGDISTTIEGLRITGGDSTGLGGNPADCGSGGGGVYVLDATVTIRSNQIFSNTTGSRGGCGGGVFLLNSRAAFIGNNINDNRAYAHGGGFYVLSSDVVLDSNIVSANIAEGYFYIIGGGGGLAFWGSTATLVGNDIIGNVTGDHGGGLRLLSSDITFIGNTIAYNAATGWGGGGLYLDGCSATFMNDSITDNHLQPYYPRSGSAFTAIGSNLRLVHTTIARNAGGDGSGISIESGYFPSTVVLTNTILVSHAIGILREKTEISVTLEATLWGTGTWANKTDWAGVGTIITGTANYRGDPDFVDADAGNYHIGPGSAAIDRGVNAGVLRDIDNEPRLGTPDLGADEYWAPGALKTIYLPLILRNGP